MKNRNHNELSYKYVKKLKPNKFMEKNFKKVSNKNNFNKMKILYNLKKVKSNKNLRIDIEKNNNFRRQNKNLKTFNIRNSNSIFNNVFSNSIKNKNISGRTKNSYMKNFCKKFLKSCKNTVDKNKRESEGKLYKNTPFKLKEINFGIKRKRRNRQILEYFNI